MKKLVRRLPLGGYEVSNDEGKSWEPIDLDEFNKALEDGAEEVPLMDADVDVHINVGDDVIEHIYMKDGNKLIFKLTGKPEIAVESDYAAIDYEAILKAIATNRENYVVDTFKRYAKIEEPEELKEPEEPIADPDVPVDDSTDETVTEDVDDAAADDASASDHAADDTLDDVPVGEPEDDTEDLTFKTLGEMLDFIKDKENKLDKAFIDRIQAESADRTLGEEVYQVVEASLPFTEDGAVKVRVVAGYKEGNDVESFVAYPDNWGSISEIDPENLDLDDANNDVNVNVVVSEENVLKNPDEFYDGVGEFFGEASAYVNEVPETPSDDASAAPGDVPTDGETIDEPKEVVSAEVTDMASDAGIAPYESVEVPYKSKTSEKWLEEFVVTDKFNDKIAKFMENLNKVIRKSLMSNVHLHIAESGKFIAVRIDKQAIKESSVSSVWFKKRLTKICESIKKYADDLRIVETRGDYFTRTFFLVESLPENYCLDVDAEVKELDLRNDKVVLEGVSMIIEANELQSVKDQILASKKPVLRPRIISKNGVIHEGYKVNNDGRTPYLVITEAEKKIVFLKELTTLKEAVVEDKQETDPAKTEATQTPDVAANPKRDVITLLAPADMIGDKPHWRKKIKEESKLYTNNISFFKATYIVESVGEDKAKWVVCRAFGREFLLAPLGTMTKLGTGVSKLEGVMDIMDIHGSPIYLSEHVVTELSKLYIAAC